MTGTPNIDRHVGRYGLIRATEKENKGNLRMRVCVVDARRMFDRVEYQVAPALVNSGEGSAWIRQDSIVWED